MNDTQTLYSLIGVFSVIWIFTLVLVVFCFICNYKIFIKAGAEGWKAIIPFYNMYTQCEFTFGNGLYFLCIFIGCIPFVGSIFLIIWYIIANIRLAKSFGKDVGFAIGLTLIPIIFLPILAFGDAQYNRLPDYDYHNPFE